MLHAAACLRNPTNPVPPHIPPPLSHYQLEAAQPLLLKRVVRYQFGGRQRMYSLAVVLAFCLTLKNLLSLALRQTTGLVQSVQQLCDSSIARARSLEMPERRPPTKLDGNRNELLIKAAILKRLQHLAVIRREPCGDLLKGVSAAWA